MARIFFFAAFVLLVFSSTAHSEIPRKINFQGVLTNASGGTMPDGEYVIEFKLYNVQSGGAPLWSEADTVTVIKGIFTSILGANEMLGLPFDEQYYLGIAIASGPELTPRMPLVASAYSLNSHNAEMLAYEVYVDGDGNVGVGIENPSEKLQVAGTIHSITGGFKFPDGTVQATAASGTAGLTLPFYGSAKVNYSAFSINNGGLGAAIKGRNDSIGTEGFLGHSQYGVLGYGSSGAFAGVGGRNENGNYALLGTSNQGVYGEHFNGHYGHLGTSDYGAYARNANGNWGYLGGSTFATYGRHSTGGYGYLGGSYYGVAGYSDTVAVHGYNMETGNYGRLGTRDQAVYGRHTTGNVGILGGTNQGVYGANANGSNGYLGGTSNGVYGAAPAGGYGGYFAGRVCAEDTIISTAGGFQFPDGTVQTTAAAGGSGGLSLPYSGTTSYESAAFRIENDGTGSALIGLAAGETDVLNFGGYFEARGMKGTGVYGLASNTEHGTGNKYGGEFVALGLSSYGVSGRANDKGGIFQATGAQGCGVYGYASNTGDGYSAGGSFSAGSLLGRGVFGAALNPGNARNYGGYFIAYGMQGIGVYAKGGTNGCAAEFVGNVVLKSKTNPDLTIMELGEGLDYAEGFNVADIDRISPGNVLIIDPANPGKLSACCAEYDNKVAGIVAGANGQGSGVRLGSGQFDCDVALAGRVYCNVDAAESAIVPGDLLTTSSIPGHAMKAIDYKRAHGAILGKAMEAMEKGARGQILVLVTLQ